MKNKWVIWNGGECPVAPDTLIQAQLRCDTRAVAEKDIGAPAGEYRWKHNDGCRTADIIAYRVKE